MKNKLITILFTIAFNICAKNLDLTILGFIKHGDGLGRIPISIMDAVKEDLNVNFIKTRNSSLEDTPKFVLDILQKNNLSTGNVTILTDVISCSYLENYKLLPNSKIKIAYSMFETTAVPKNWPFILNSKFDLLVVPDNFLKKIYQRCGVNIPIFVLPIPLYLEQFQNLPTKIKKNDKFIIGCLSSYDDRKNHDALISAFCEEFKNDENVELRINGRTYADNNIFNNLVSKYKNYPQVKLTNFLLSWEEYVKFFKSLDCYINVSKGEGFSIPPREALAAGIPCIISNNTAQKTICRTGYVKSVDWDKLEPAYYKEYGRVGNFFNCDVKEIRKALREVYENYEKYLDFAQKGKEWTKNYLINNLKLKYINLIKPKEIKLGPENKLTDDYLMTNSHKLYSKYKVMLSNV